MNKTDESRTETLLHQTETTNEVTGNCEITSLVKARDRKVTTIKKKSICIQLMAF